MRELLVVLMLCGCAGAAEEPEQADVTLIPADDWRGCARVFSPAPDVAELTRGALRQWQEATGCDLRIADAGIPVRFVERILNDAGEPQCGVTRRSPLSVEISTNLGDRCYDRPRNLLHELGHALAPGRTHTSEGLMASVPNDTDYVDGVSAAFVCGELLR